MRRYYSLLFITLSLLFINYYLLSDSPFSSGKILSAISSRKSAVTVSLSIGEYQFTLFGHSSPYALVTIEGLGIYDQTYTDNRGYFEFKNRFSPFSPREACLSVQDQFGRNSAPSCLPPFPTNRNVTIGPVILPPTLSLDKPDYFIGDEVVVSGQTVPNSEVGLSVFTKNKSEARISNFKLVKPVYAFTFPELTAKADKYGNFSISLPSGNPESFRLFAQTDYLQSPSAKSTALNLKILPWWMIIIKFFLFIWSLLRPRIIEIIIVIQMIIMAVYLLRRFFLPHEIARNRAIVVKKNFPLANSY